LPRDPHILNSNEVDPLLSPHGHSWTNNGEVSFDVTTKYHDRAKIIWKGPRKYLSDRSEADYLKLMFPIKLVHVAVELTNEEFIRRGMLSNFTEEEFWRYLGIRLAMTVAGDNKTIPEYWNETEDLESFDPPLCFGRRFDMTRHRFENITAALRFARFDTGVLDEVLHHKLMLSILNSVISSGSLVAS
jgi:hypothetical protein